MKKHGLLEADWNVIKAEMRHILIGLARLRKTIYYSDLSAQIQTAYIHYRAPAFNRILNDLADDEAKAGYPKLAVLVVNKQTNRCGAGFFKAWAEQGCDVSDPEAFWQTEFNRVCDFWANSEE